MNPYGRTKMKKFVGVISLALTVVIVAPSNVWAYDAQLSTTLVAEVPHELPAPAIAVNEAGVSLVAWLGQDPSVTDADPDLADNQVCTNDGEYCDIVYALVDENGTVLTDVQGISPFNVSYYYAAPSVTWNPDLNEWVVFMSSYDVEDGLWAQRVSEEGNLVGSAVSLPFDRVTAFDNRSSGAILDLPDMDDVVQISGEWSSTDQAYFVTWYGNDNLISSDFDYGTNGSGNEAVFGVFLDGDLAITDGVDASFIVSWDAQTDCCHVGLGYSEERNEWIVGWRGTNSDYTYATVANPDAPEVSDDHIIVDISDYTSVDNRNYNGGFVWVESEGKWFGTWALKTNELNEGVWGLFGSWISLDGTVSEPILIDSGTEVYLDAQSANAETPVDPRRIMRQSIDLDAETGILHLAYSKDFNNTPDSQDEDTSADGYRQQAYYTTLDLTTEEVVDEYQLSEEWPLDSSRPRLDVNNGRVAITVQDWSNGDWEDPSEVRIVTLGEGRVSEDQLPNTGASVGTAGMMGALLLLAGAGVYAVRRRRV
ncbi:MAG: LPXTG cell wall anchor domain-containing protein [Microbacteriaceae bacterium]